jgi:uncharacterized protein
MQSAAVDLSKYAPEFEIFINVVAPAVLQTIRHATISVQINEEIGKVAEFSFLLADQFDVKKQEFVWLDNPLLSPGQNMKINIGYAKKLEALKKLEEMIEGEVKTISTSGFSLDIPKLTIQGYHKGHCLLTEESSGDKPIKLDKNDTYSKIADKLADAAHLGKDIDQTKSYSPIITKKTIVYNDFLNDAAKRVAYEFFIARKTLFFIDPRQDKGLVTRVEVRGHPSNSKGNIIGTAEAGSEDVLEKGKKTASQLAVKICKEKKLDIKDRIISSKQEADDIAKAELNKVSDNLITGSGSTVGTPELAPGQILELKGVGTRFSGRYFVTKVTNSIDGNGYKTSFNVRKNVM